jgi:uncharacterized protein (TIGR02646 family)
MIRVKPPPEPDELRISAAAELAENAGHAPAGPFRFEAYKVAAVKQALNAAFCFKCAYCESNFGATQPVAIEHYRPKGKIRTRDGELVPGYYWLAADWENLLPSCTDCNSPRRQTIGGVEITAGKGNWFPLASERHRAKAPRQEADEERLLLHPYRDFPQRHLEFIDEGVVRPRLSPGGRASPKGQASIEVYALQRPGLVKAREAMQIRVRAQLAVVRREAARLDADPRNAAQAELLRTELAGLRRLMAPEQPYSEIARQTIEPAMRELMP